MKKDLRYLYLFYVLLIISGIVFYFNNTEGKMFRLILTAVTLGLIMALYIWLKFNKVIYYISLIFVFIAMYLGNILDFYGFYGYDKFLHFSSGVLLYIIGDIILSKYIKDEYRLVRYVVPVFFSISFAGIWEIWEYSTDSILNFKSQGGLDDTMWDIICGSIGAMITFFIFYCKFIALKRRKI